MILNLSKLTHNLLLRHTRLLSYTFSRFDLFNLSILGIIFSFRMDSMELFEKVAKQGDSVRKLKSEKASKDDIMAAVELLKQLKVEFKEATGQDYQPG